MASSSPTSSNQESFKYQVYISFSGIDTRKTFVDHLYASLKRQGIHTFSDRDDLKKGNVFDGCFKAIEDSRFFIIVFSQNYASSSWCLKEVTKIMECQDGNQRIAFPLYYNVEPKDIRNQSGPIGRAIADYETHEQIKKWKKALKGAADLVGWDLKNIANGHEAEAIEQIVKDISHNLRFINLSNSENLIGMEHRMHPEKIPLEHIKYCTQDFDKKNIIGRGGYGKVYKGILTWADHVNKLVAVKRLNVDGGQGSKEFHTEVTMLSQYQHENIITLIGFCDDYRERILVYEYASHGSLDTCIRVGGLSWPQLLKICIDVASALDYLHNHVAEKHRIIHRDIKSPNVLLDESWNAKLSDFGLARIGPANQQNTYVITNMAGTPGYNDPQYERTGFLTKESDVYSFGVVLFEVLCGRLACEYGYQDERRFLHHLARTQYKSGDLEEIIDHRIRKDIKETTLSKFSAIAYQCIQETREARPAIAEVAFQLKEARKIQLEDEDNGGY